MYHHLTEDLVGATDPEARRPAALLGRDGAAGARAMLPLLVAYAPLALMVGAAVAVAS